ncbi:HAMP domain-containing sensor histidine kinase, partial [Vibrio sinaloensis]
AVKYGTSAEVAIGVSDEWITITVDDAGPGIPEEKQEQVFEPYFRLADDDQGHGLGLGICRNILHGHGGDLIISNRPNGGLRAQLFIPPSLEV